MRPGCFFGTNKASMALRILVRVAVWMVHPHMIGQVIVVIGVFFCLVLLHGHVLGLHFGGNAGLMLLFAGIGRSSYMIS